MLLRTQVKSPSAPAKPVSTCGDASFDYPYLKSTLIFLKNEAIAGIETKKQRELSLGYTYPADMTAGEFEGKHYDG